MLAVPSQDAGVPAEAGGWVACVRQTLFMIDEDRIVIWADDPKA